ncbi:helix-turn-helix domain-containing protein [Halolamina litorea]|uniref:ArsR/SmtB family transcription factor n=1 Tax=Halolamina litorea TaxID=1515593 RepID=A0ABD6BNX5_9EURY|nr:helix-turn-helix domain-containing protein [Halolamina litorea]
MAADEIIEVLGHKYNPEILEAASEPKSAQELSDELGVPIATCYRRIEELTEADLLELHDRPLSEEHRRIRVYRRSVEELTVDFRDGLSVEVERRSEVANTLDEVWRRMSADGQR